MQPHSLPSARNLVRSTAAVLAGLVANVVLGTATDLLLVRTGVFPPFTESQAYTNTLLAVALTYRTVYGVVAAYLTARLAPQRPMLHAWVLGWVGVLLAAVGVLFVASGSTAWYALALVVVALPAAWVGGRLAAAPFFRSPVHARAIGNVAANSHAGCVAAAAQMIRCQDPADYGEAYDGQRRRETARPWRTPARTPDFPGTLAR